MRAIKGRRTHRAAVRGALARGVTALVASFWLGSCGRVSDDGLSPADSVLNRALEQDDLAAAERALRSGANPNANLGVGTVLAKAVMSNDPALVGLVLKAGADPNLCPPDTWCPLTGALHAVHVDSTRINQDADRDTIAALLLRAGADPNGSPNDPSSPLQRAIELGRTRIATLLIEAGASPQGRAPKDGPLPAALKRGDHAMVRRLVAARTKLDPDPVLLKEIASNGDAESLDVALGLTRESTAGGECDLTAALAAATEKDCAECVRLLLAAGARYTLLEQYSSSFSTTWFEVIGKAGPTVLEVYAGNGLDPRAVDADNTTLLHFAAGLGKADSVKWLVSRGVPVDAPQATTLRTPLMFAAAGGYVEAVKALLDVGASAALHDAWGKTPKMLAAQVETRTAAYDEVVRLLHARGAVEYTGAQLPPSKYDAEVAGREHNDVTAGFYTQLPFLKPGLRFFGVYASRPSPNSVPVPIQIPARLTPAPGMLYAVLPDRSVLKLTRPDDIRTLGVQLRSEDDALRLVRVYTDPSYAHQMLLRAQFDTPQYSELSEDGGCYMLTGWEGPRNPVVVRDESADGAHYIVTRYVIPLAKLPSIGSQVKLDEIVRTTERVQPDGAYSVKTEVIKAPGVVLRYGCALL